ncbi:MAG: hypothetical protein P4N60_21635 [Verrucomicrobiae bacterium]|nr:hypothetical protein [Verrucomicrobiae bacterium]
MSTKPNLSRLALLFVLILATGTSSFAQPFKNILIPSNVPWTDTGIDVTKGSWLFILADGKVLYWDFNHATTDANGVNWDGTGFFPNAVLPDAIVVSLIGKIGGTTEIGTGTPVPAGKKGDGTGFVGKSYLNAMPKSGRLFLGFNDTPNAFGDNIGSFHVSIFVIKPIQPAQTALKDGAEAVPKGIVAPVIDTATASAAGTSMPKLARTSSNPTQTVNIGIYAGIEIQDSSNQVCGIQYCTDLSNTNQWQGLTNVVPDSSSFIWFDITKSANSGQRFYRVLPGPIPVP